MISHDYKSKLSDVKIGYIQRYLQGEEVLDVGAGYCYYSEWLISQKPMLKVVSLDQLDLDSHKGFTFMRVDLEQPIALHNEQFSTILAFDVIEHITNETQFLHELYRLCKYGGILIGSVPHDDDQFLPAYNLTFNHRRDLTHKRYYVPTSLHEALSTAGFNVLCIDKRGIVSPQVIAEFFPHATHYFIKKMVGLLRRIGVINPHVLASDLFFIAKKVNPGAKDHHDF